MHQNLWRKRSQDFCGDLLGRLILFVCVMVAGCTAVVQQSMLVTDSAETARESPLTVVENYVAGHPPTLLETTRYTSTDAAFVLMLPDFWSGHYGVVEAGGEDAAALFPKAQHVVTFVYIPMATDHVVGAQHHLPARPLLAIYLFGQRDWESIGRDVSDTLGRIVAETETQVYVAAMPLASPYPDDSEDTVLFDRMLLSNQEVRDLIRVGDLTARTDADELASATWVWRETLIGTGAFCAISAPPTDTEKGASYTLAFGDDGRVQIQAGCHVGEASYTAGSGRMRVDISEMSSAEEKLIK